MFKKEDGNDQKVVAWLDDKKRLVRINPMEDGGHVDSDRAIPSSFTPLVKKQKIPLDIKEVSKSLACLCDGWRNKVAELSEEKSKNAEKEWLEWYANGIQVALDNLESILEYYGINS